MSPYYLLTSKKKTWEPRFEPLFNLLQWLVYEGLNYVLDVMMRKMQKGRRKKKRIHNVMDDSDRVMTMVCMVSVTSTKTKQKYIVQSVMVKATPWKDTRKVQRESQEIVAPRIQVVDGGQVL
jgi:hypothetical protein